MKRKNIFILIVIFLCLSFLGILAMQMQEKNGGQEVDTPTQMSDPLGNIDANKALTSSEIISESQNVAQWKTYRNEEYGFEFKYPGDMFEVFVDKDGDVTLDLFFNVPGNTVRSPILTLFFNSKYNSSSGESDYSASVIDNICRSVPVGNRNGEICYSKTLFDVAVSNYNSFLKTGNAVCVNENDDSSLVVELKSKDVNGERVRDGVDIDFHCSFKKPINDIVQKVYGSIYFFDVSSK